LLTRHTEPEQALPPLLVHQQKVVDQISQCYQQLQMLSATKQNGYKRLLRTFQVALDLQEHISVSLHQPGEVQKLVERSHAEAVLRWTAQTVATRLRTLSDDILYHRYSHRFSMDKQVEALAKIARQHPDNPVGQFCEYHFSRIARVLRTQRPLYARDLMDSGQRRLPLLRALKSYLSLKSAALRTAARLGVMLAAAGLLGSAFQLPKPYWILMTVLFVTQNGYGATRVRILHRAGGTLAGLIIAGITLHLKVPQGYTLLGMLLVTLISYLIIRRHYGWAMIGFTVTAVYSLQILTLNGEQYIVARLIDTLSGCLIAFGGMVWLWPQWQSGLLRQNAHDALEADQEALRLILSDDPQPGPLAWQRMQVNQAHNALYNSLNQAMQEPGFNSRYLEDMRLWVTHSQFIVEHINAITTMAREQTTLTPETAARYLQACEIALQRCQQRLEHDAPGDTQNEAVLEGEDVLPDGAPGVMEHHLLRILDHLRTMHTISSVAWRQRPHHGIWLRRRLSQPQ
ncbi:YccS/YhfK family putative transporter, partial [Cronobacter malonaticus]